MQLVVQLVMAQNGSSTLYKIPVSKNIFDGKPLKSYITKATILIAQSSRNPINTFWQIKLEHVTILFAINPQLMTNCPMMM